MLATNHVLAGTLIGRVARRPAPAFAVGVVSHLVMDAVPHWGIDKSGADAARRFYAVAAVDGVVLTAVLALMVRRQRPAAEIAGALGALLLDLDKPAALLGVRQLWPDRVTALHSRVQRETPRRWWVELAAVSGLAIAVGR